MKHRHNLDSITGYRVVETNREHDMFGAQRIIVEFNGPTRAANATEVATEITKDDRRGFGTVDTFYVCGCVSVARRPGELGIDGVAFEDRQRSEATR